jgi:hypothetical protein
MILRKNSTAINIKHRILATFNIKKNSMPLSNLMFSVNQTINILRKDNGNKHMILFSYNKMQNKRKVTHCRNSLKS